jgi:hypothetical protein
VGKRATSALIAGVVFVGACSGGSKNAVPTSTKPTDPANAPARTATPPRPTATTTTPEYSFDDSVPPPKLVNTGTNYVAILKSLNRYASWLAAHHPDPALVSTVVVGGTKQHALLSLTMRHLRGNHVRLLEKVGATPDAYTILSATSDAFSAELVQDVLVHETVNRRGRVTTQVRFDKPTTYLMLVVRVGSHWYFAAVDKKLVPNVRL